MLQNQEGLFEEFEQKMQGLLKLHNYKPDNKAKNIINVDFSFIYPDKLKYANV